MHPVARFAHSLKRLFTTCRVFSGSFTGKAWCKQEQFKSALSTTLMHMRTSWCVRKKMEGGVKEARPSYKSCSSDALESQTRKNAKCLVLKGHGPVLTSRAWLRTQNKLKALLPPVHPFNALQSLRSPGLRTFCQQPRDCEAPPLTAQMLRLRSFRKTRQGEEINSFPISQDPFVFKKEFS